MRRWEGGLLSDKRPSAWTERMEIHQSGGLAETVFCCLWMVAGTRFELWKRLLRFEFLLGPLLFLVSPGPLFADEVVHHRHVDRVAGRAEAAELPAVLDRPQEGVVVVGDGRAACRVVGAGDHDREYVSAARAGAAASACVRKPTRARRAHIALVPRDEDHRVPLPGARGHDLADPAPEERVASGDQLRRVREATRIARRAATVHVMTLIGTDPVVVGDFTASEVGLELMQVDDLGHPHRVALHGGVGDERVVLPYVKLVAARGGRGVAAAERIRLHVGFPRFPP